MYFDIIFERDMFGNFYLFYDNEKYYYVIHICFGLNAFFFKKPSKEFLKINRKPSILIDPY